MPPTHNLGNSPKTPFFGGAFPYHHNYPLSHSLDGRMVLSDTKKQTNKQTKNKKDNQTNKQTNKDYPH